MVQVGEQQSMTVLYAFNSSPPPSLDLFQLARGPYRTSVVHSSPSTLTGPGCLMLISETIFTRTPSSSLPPSSVSLLPPPVLAPTSAPSAFYRAPGSKKIRIISSPSHHGFIHLPHLLCSALAYVKSRTLLPHRVSHRPLNVDLVSLTLELVDGNLT